MIVSALAVGAVATLLFIIIVYIWPSGHYGQFWKLAGPRPLPIIGNTHQIPSDAKAFYHRLIEYCVEYRKEPLFRLKVGPRYLVVAYRPEVVEVVLNSTKHIGKSEDYRYVEPWLGKGLLTSNGEKWRMRRRLLTPTFHFRILQHFHAVFVEQSEILTRILATKVGHDAFDICPYITRCTLDIICETAMGKGVNAQEDTESDYVNAIYRISEIIHRRQKAPWMWPDWLFCLLPIGREHQHCLDVLHGFSKKVILDRSEEFKLESASADVTKGMACNEEETESGSVYLGQRKRVAFLDLLLQTEGMTFDDIREEVDTFMFEGHDTTAAAANWALHLIGANPDVQEKIQEELKAVFGSDDKRSAAVQDICKLKYLECVIKETLRLFPSVPIFARKLDADVIVGDKVVPKGCSFVVLTTQLHRDERYFPNPEKFDPGRFNKDNTISTDMHPYAYIPFSAGLRNCIGQKFAMNELKVVLSSLLRAFSIKSTQSREELDPTEEIILRPSHGIWVELSQRE